MTSTDAQPRKRRAYAPRMPAEQRRTQLLDAALHLAVTRGHRAVTMEAVAAQANVTKPVVYGMFSNRAELLAALLHREQDGALGQVFALLPDPSDRATARLPDLLAGVLDRFLQAVRAAPKRWYCIVMPMPDMPEEFQRAREQGRNVALSHVERIARDVLCDIGAPPGLAPDIVAHTVVSMFEMAARLALTDPEHFQPERLVTALHTALDLLPTGPPKH